MTVQFTLDYANDQANQDGEAPLIGWVSCSIGDRAGDFRVRNLGAGIPRVLNIATRRGYLAADGHLYKDTSLTEPFRLVANDPAFNLRHITYRVDFDLSTLEGDPVPIPHTFFPAPGVDTIAYLARAISDPSQPIMEVRSKGYAEDILDAAAVGINVLKAATTSAARTAIDLPRFDIREVGGDLKAAFAEMPKGGTLLIPDGVWEYDGDNVPARGTVFQGSGRVAPQPGFSGSPRLLAAEADARLFLDDQCHLENVLIDGNGLGKWAIQTGNPTGTGTTWVPNKVSLSNVYIYNFTEAALVMEALQNSVLTNVSVHDCPVGYWFLHGAANVELNGCAYVNTGNKGGTAARAILVKGDYSDLRLMEAKRFAAGQPHYAVDKGAREIRWWGGICELSPGEYLVELLDGNTFATTFILNGTQLQQSAGTAMIHIGRDWGAGELIVRDCRWNAPSKVVVAESGTVAIYNLKLNGSGANSVPNLVELSGDARYSYYDELSRRIIDSTFETGLTANSAYSWAPVSTGSRVWSSEKKCMEMTLPSSSAGVGANPLGYSPLVGPVTVRFKLSNCGGPVLLRTNTSPVTTVGTFGNGAHEFVYDWTGAETRFYFTSGAGTSITADLNYFIAEQGIHSGAYPPALTPFDGVLRDAAGNPWLGVTRNANAGNYISVANRASPNPAQIIASGSDPNAGVDIVTGTGPVMRNGVALPENSITSTHTVQQLEIGHASDTTLTRLSAGRLAVEGVPLVRRTIQTLTGAETISATSGDQVRLIDTGGLPTLATAVGATDVIELINLTAAGVAIGTTSSQTIGGESSYVLPAGHAITLVSDQTNWKIK